MTGETSPIELWEHPLSPYAQKVKIALMEKGVPFSSKTPHAIGSGSTAEEFRKISFRGEVPVLIIEGHAIADSTIILEFLEERFPHPRLLPTDPFERARARMIEEVCDTHFEAINWGLSEIVHFKRATGELAGILRTRAGEQIGRLHGWLERELAEPEWFGGEQFGWADVSAVAFVQGASSFGFAPAEGSRLGRWLERCTQRHSVSAVFQAAGQSAAVMKSVAGLIKTGAFKRQYRDYRLEWMIRSGGLQVVLEGLKQDSIRFNSEPS